MPTWGSDLNYREFEKRRAEVRRKLLEKYPKIGPRKLEILIRRKVRAT